MKRLLLVLFLVMLFYCAKASHIVGGEMALVHTPNTQYRYKLELILYYDAKFGATGGDATALVRIFRKRDNTALLDILLNAAGPFSPPPNSYAIGTPVEYFQPECSDGSIETNRVFYESTEFELSPTVFNDPEGYYVVYERCCRNYIISNIYSEDPFGGNYPHIAGQIFYLEFPAVIKDNEPFINSSPKLFPPLSDFGCPNRNYFVDFAGTDEDGDSLVYSLVTPLNSKERIFALPGNGPNPGPYDSVTWKPGFGNQNFMNGNPDLNISSDGLLTVTPSPLSIGLYVFAVRCEEFRDGVKIGEVRRDFQMLIQDGCPVAEPPKIVGKAPDDIDFGTTGNLSVTFENTVSDEDRCFEVKISDPDALKFDDDFKENIRIKAIPIGFKRNISEVLPVVTTATITNDGTAIFNICLPKCPYLETGIFQLGIIAFDDACTLPLSDTLIVTINLEPPPNQLPQFNNPGSLTEIMETIEEGDPLHTWPLQVTDADGDVLTYRLVPVGFTLENAGMAFTGALSGQQTGPLNKALTWNPKCDVYDFTKKTNFELYFIVDDNDQCLFNHADTTTFNLTIDLPGNSDPVIDNTIIPAIDTLEITRKIYGEPIQINVSGTDADVDDVIVLRGNGIGFNASAYGVTFPKISGKGALLSQFNWSLTCENINLEERDIFEFNLQVVDSTNKCGFYKADTLRLIVHVEAPDNEQPGLVVLSENANQPIIDGSLVAILGDSISLTLTGMDADINPKDLLKIELFSQSGNVEPKGYFFTEQQKDDPVHTTFTWDADCSIFENGVYENQYTFKFLLSDNRCFNEKADTVTLDITIQDVDGGDRNFLPPNVFSPNGDDKNEFFAMVKETETPGEFVSILPNDNCLGEFLSVGIYNRWGKQIYESLDRDFRWYGEGMPVGVYYYFLKYSNREYKGTISIQY